MSNQLFNPPSVCFAHHADAKSGTNLIPDTRERAKGFLTDMHLLRIVRAYQEFKDEPGFTRVAPIQEIRAKEGNLSIPPYLGRETQAQADVATEEAALAGLPDALSAWPKIVNSARHLLG